MKRLSYLLGIIAPFITAKTIAQDFDLSVVRGYKPQDRASDKLDKARELEAMLMYEQSSKVERAYYLYKVVATSQEQLRSGVNRQLVERRVDYILGLSEEEQKKEMIEEIRRGGMKWGKIGDPTKPCL
jgi:hypothetical protein